jgi:hypothetical protein
MTLRCRLAGPLGLLAVLWAAWCPVPAEVTLASKGRHALPVVVAHDGSPAERTAARELVFYLEKATGANFKLVTEPLESPAASAIWVGPTEMARNLGIDPRAMGRERWVVRTEGSHLVLAGGRPRGTLYAVYRFLEQHVGVRWWTPFEEHVPRRKQLVVEANDTGEPAFAYRDIQGVAGPSEFHARNRANGHFSFLPDSLGGNEGYGPPSMVHTFYRYVPPDEFFESRPEYFSERKGKRVARGGQLCLTNLGLVEIVAERMRGYIEKARAEAAERGERPPRIFDVSQNDWARPCTCRTCSAVDAEQESHAGSLMLFINRLAALIGETHPDVFVDTLAYEHTLDPPLDTRYADNVIVRLAGLYQRDFSRSVTDEANRFLREAIEDWSARTAHLRIWDYAVTFGTRPANLPLPNLRVIADDFRFYLEQGVEGLFIQHGHPVHSDIRDLKLWIVFKLAEDPGRDLDDLVRDFTDGFYGPAAATVREYLAALEQAARLVPSTIRHPTDYEQYDYLSPEFLRIAQSLFDRAMDQAERDRRLRRRLRHARLTLDRATLLLWDPSLAEPAGSESDGAALEAAEVARRYFGGNGCARS